jgi:cytochrome c-type biogenesis protein CcsB
MLIFVGSLVYHLYGYVLRWIASGRAPLSNGYESLIFIALTVAVVGVVFELRSREGVAAGLASLLTAVILGTAMLATFDPDIGPLVPVLASYWLNIHVTVITASYAFLGLSAALGAQTLLVYLAKAPGRERLRAAIQRLDRLNCNVMLTGVAFLTVGTLLGGVWANESWGRYWGWDPKETWSFVTILVYVVILHLRFIPPLRSSWLHAALSLAAIASVVMTYFGVNYFLSGLHSYAAGEAARVPAWVHIGVLAITLLVGVSFAVHRLRRWQPRF